jgi:hypothetical protein
MVSRTIQNLVQTLSREIGYRNITNYISQKCVCMAYIWLLSVCDKTLISTACQRYVSIVFQCFLFL